MAIEYRIEPPEERSNNGNSLIDFLFNTGTPEVTKADRIKITATCKDSDYIPKVKNAGMVIKSKDGNTYQVMHNGLKVKVDGYYGSWVTNSIKDLKGHHEPQEEKVFYEVSKRFDKGTAMIELGSYWAFYSLWFRDVVKDGLSICCEPDPHNIGVGSDNFELNNISNVHFVPSAAGSEDGKVIQFETETPGEFYDVEIRSVDSLVKEFSIDKLEVLHMDVQGAELDSLHGALATIKSGKLRFVFISTHHYLISRDPNIHNKCIDYIKQNGGHIIADHDIHESFSGDGLIVASFDERDSDFTVDVSRNRMSNNQFRAYTEDLEASLHAYEIQLQRIAEKNESISLLNQENEMLNERIKVLSQIIEFHDTIGVKGATKKLVKAVYNSTKHRFSDAYWGYGDAKYSTTPALLDEKSNFNIDNFNPNVAIKAIADSDSKNYQKLAKRGKRKTAIYDKLQKGFRKVVK